MNLKEIRLVTIIIIIVLKLYNVNGQDCPPDDIIFFNQESIDDYVQNYPDCKIIEGLLWISGNKITNLDFLSQIEIIKSDFILEDTETLLNTSGLSSLQEVHGSIEIRGNRNLVDIDEISSLVVHGTRIFITGNENLKLINGFNNKQNQNTIWIRENQSLDSINAFHSIESMSGSIKIEMNDSLKYINLLSDVDSCNSLAINFNRELNEFNGFNNLKIIESGFSILNEGQKMSIPSFNFLEECGDIQINFSGEEIVGFTNLNFVHNDISINFCDSLKIIDGFNSLKSVRNINVTGSQKLHTMNAFQNVVVVDAIILQTMFNLENFNAFHSLEEVQSDLLISSFNKIEELTNFSNLKKVKKLLISSSSGIANIFDNLTPFENIDVDFLEEVGIWTSPNLSICSIDFMCEFLNKPNAIYSFASNAPGCNSAEEILAACNMVNTSDEPSFADNIHIIPNPVSDQLLVDVPKDLEVSAWNIFSSQGRSLLRGNELVKPIDVSLFDNGIYFLNLELNRGNLVKKIIITH